ncbi:MAG: hypothetical protein PHQ12_02435 [Chthoniobacteraceae bacterium]|nr:hypothetical protein [Chthoniobacteraceae bacterium]
MNERLHLMPQDRSKPARRHSQRGVAIVIVLAVIVLLAGLVMAFFSRVSVERTATNSDVSAAKADLLARSALDSIVSDLKQEIVVSSSSVVVGTGANATTLYLPKTPAAILPARSGTPGTSPDPIPNLIRRSVRYDAIAVSSSASAVNSSTDVSLNGRSVSPARWNAHYLIPRLNYSSTDVDSTPVGDFTAPDWVFVNRNGRVVLATISAALFNAAQSNQSFVIGRYAYAIYDEGGLLDVNVAGYPSAAGATAVGRKGPSAFADLTQLPTENGTLSASLVDKLVGWRNYATAQPAGAFPGFTFDSTSANRYLGYVTTNTNGFLSLSGTTFNSRTDQAVLTRQQLLQLGRSLGMSQNAFQYLGTFSRDLEQPSFIPNPNRPKVQAAAGNNSATFGTGSDAFGNDRDATDASRDINPPFLSVRVATPFTRSDGSAATVGEPLIKKRFPLSRLGLILRTSTASKSENDPIYHHFGLYRSSTTEPWHYDHGNTTGILRLAGVAGLAAGREPDFFELLKAAINVGSLGKGGCNGTAVAWNVASSANNFQQYSHDTLVDLQVLQIGANIIDQYDSDSFPTRISFSGDALKEARGVEDLPYLYRLRTRPVKASGTNSSMLFITPEVWNPHAAPATPPTDAPAQIRFRAEDTVASMPCKAKILYYPPNKTDPAPSTTITIDWASAGTLTFNNSSSNFRESTLLTEQNIPAGSSLAGTVCNENTTSKNLVGLRAAAFDWIYNPGGGGAQTMYLGDTDYGPQTYYLEYYDGANWVVYDQQYYQWSALKIPLNGSTDQMTNLQAFKSYMPGGVRTDPRTSRWGITLSNYFYMYVPIDAANYIYPSQWPDLTNPSAGAHAGGPGDNGILNNYSSYTNDEYGNQTGKYRGFQAGYLTENSVRPCQSMYTPPGDLAHYARDPDGVPRRAMGGYASDPNNGGSLSSPAGLPMITNNNASRPIILNRPFRSVAELGYTFRESPWRNLDFSFPESADAALLDVFCINEPGNPEGMVAGRVNLSTRQAPVIQALLGSALADDPNGVKLSDAQAKSIAAQLVSRTSGTLPLTNRSELIGRWSSSVTSAAAAGTAIKANADPDVYYSGFSSDIGKASGVSGSPVALIPRQREAVMRALGDAGNTRTWNLLIDVVAQSGRYPAGPKTLADFVVEGEKRYWLHVAIDRYTGKVLDSQLECVK